MPVDWIPQAGTLADAAAFALVGMIAGLGLGMAASSLGGTICNLMDMITREGV